MSTRTLDENRYKSGSQSERSTPRGGGRERGIVLSPDPGSDCSTAHLKAAH